MSPKLIIAMPGNINLAFDVATFANGGVISFNYKYFDRMDILVDGAKFTEATREEMLNTKPHIQFNMINKRDSCTYPPEPTIFVKKGPDDYAPGPMRDGTVIPQFPSLAVLEAAAEISAPSPIKAWWKEINALPNPPEEVEMIFSKSPTHPERGRERMLFYTNKKKATPAAPPTQAQKGKQVMHSTAALAGQTPMDIPSSSSTPPAIKLSAKKAKQVLRRQKFLQKGNQPFPFKLDLIEEIYRYLQFNYKNLIPPVNLQGKPADIQGHGAPVCIHHLKAGHTLQDCVTFKMWLQKEVAEGRIMLPAKYRA